MDLPDKTEFQIALHQRDTLEIGIVVIHTSPNRLLFLGEENLLFGDAIRLHPGDGPSRRLNGHPVRFETERPLPISYLTEEPGDLDVMNPLGNDHPEEPVGASKCLGGLPIEQESQRRPGGESPGNGNCRAQRGMNLEIKLEAAPVESECRSWNICGSGIGGGEFEQAVAQRLNHFLVRNLGLGVHRRTERHGKKTRNQERGDRHTSSSRGT